MDEKPVAIVTGQGVLPEMLANALAQQGRKMVLVCFNGFKPDWYNDQPMIKAVFEKPGAMFKALHKFGCEQVIFAGSMIRPQLNPLKFDLKMLSLAPKLLPKIKDGDTQTLSAIQSIFEAEGFEIIGAHEILSNLLAPSGILTKIEPSADDYKDIERAKELVACLGKADVGQGTVVAQGLCLGIETIQGTDAMLNFVATTSDQYRPDQTAGQGVLLKAPKSGQDWRIDLPAIGATTIQNAAKAGLSGIAVQSNAVLILGFEQVVELAEKNNLFIYGYSADE